MTQPSPRELIENLWDRATPVGPLLDAYRDDIAIDMGRDLLRQGLKAFLLRLIGERNTDMILESVRAAVLRNDAYRAAVLREAADAIDARQDKLDAEIRAEYGELDRDTEVEGAATRAMATHVRRMADGSQP